MHTNTLAILATLATTVALPAQVTYIDAVVGGNTTLADGSAFVPATTTSGNDDNWTQRAFANGGTILESNNPTIVGFENAPMLRTTITGLTPGDHYNVYAYFWTDTGRWRLRGLVSPTQPAAPLPGYNSRHFNTSAFDPAAPVALGSPMGTQQVSRDEPFDAAGMSTGAYFTAPVLVQEGNRWLFEAFLGAHRADAVGEIQVYIDDLEGATTTSDRTWYDGVGHSRPVPDHIRQGCGNPTIPTIALTGPTDLSGTPFSLDLADAPPTSPAVLLIGFSDDLWSGIPLPFDFGLIGYPGCELNVAWDLQLATATDAAGTASTSLTNTGLFFTPIYWQWLALDFANPQPLSATKGLETVFQ